MIKIDKGRHVVKTQLNFGFPWKFSGEPLITAFLHLRFEYLGLAV